MSGQPSFESVDEDIEPVFSQSSNSLSTSQNTQTIDTFDQIIKQFVEDNRPKLYILTPCFGSMCFLTYVTCLMNTIALFRQHNFPLVVQFCKNDSLVSRARNNLVAKAMNDPEMTHIIFIDNDISWSPIDIFKLVLSTKPVCGGIYPIKNYNWNKLVKDEQNPYNTNVIQTWKNKLAQSQLNGMFSDEKMIQFNLLKYNVNYLANILTIENNLAKVRHLATGFMMIKREVIEKMFAEFPSSKYIDDIGFLSGTENNYAYAIFDCAVEDGHYLSEDWLFSNRWIKMGGDIFIDVTINLTHTGIEDYHGSLLASLI